MHGLLLKILYKFSPKVHVFFGVLFLVFKSLLKKLYQVQNGLTHIILSYINFHLKLIDFLVLFFFFFGVQKVI